MQLQLIEDISSFLFISDPPEHSDIIFIPGSKNKALALYAANLYHEGYAPYILPSGLFAMDQDRFPVDGYQSEWEWIRDILLQHRVPQHAILREDQARYTLDNAQRSRVVTDELGLTIQRAILCCRPFHAQRARFYYQYAYPDTVFRVCPVSEPGLQRDDWFLSQEGRARVLGEIRRLGDQIMPQFDVCFTRGKSI